MFLKQGLLRPTLQKMSCIGFGGNMFFYKHLSTLCVEVKNSHSKYNVRCLILGKAYFNLFPSFIHFLTFILIGFFLFLSSSGHCLHISSMYVRQFFNFYKGKTLYWFLFRVMIVVHHHKPRIVHHRQTLY